MKQLFKKIGEAVSEFLNSRGTRKVFSSLVGCVVIISLVMTALLFSSSASAMEEADRLERTGGDDVKNYISVPALIRLAYEEPVYVLLHMEASSTPDEIEVAFLNPEGKQEVGMPFGITVTDEEGTIRKLLDEDCDGRITVSDVEPGVYKISFVHCEGYRADGDIEVTVEPPVEHVQIDVREQIIDSGSVDTTNEDKQYGKPTRPDPIETPAIMPGDTVIFVESERIVKKEEKEVPVVDSDGNQLYESVPELSAADENGNTFLILNDGSDTVSDVRASKNSDGTLASAERYDAQSDSWNSCKSEVIDSTGRPVNGSDGSTAVYKFSSVTALVKTEVIETVEYRGWQEIDGNTYYFDINGVPVTGSQVIQGESYWFNSEGVRSSIQGIDVSTWNGDINWNKVKNADIDFVIIRVGFRGYSAGKLYSDDMFEKYITGAKAAGLKVGLYFYTQAISEREAVEEASLCLTMLNGRSLNYPIFIDMEDAESRSARTNNLTNAQRTNIINAFCDTIRSAGYTAGLYANKYYLTYMINMSQISSSTRIWIAHYTSQAHPEYQTMYDMWQYSATGSIPGIYGNVDLDISYM